MKREEEALPLSGLEVTVDGLLPKKSRTARAAYWLMMILLLVFMAAVIA